MVVAQKVVGQDIVVVAVDLVVVVPVLVHTFVEDAEQLDPAMVVDKHSNDCSMVVDMH